MKKSYTNTTGKIQIVGGKLIHPGVTRMIEMPETAAEKAPADLGFDPSVIMSQTVKSLPEALSTLNLDQLSQALVFEQSNAKRVTAVEAIEEAIEALGMKAELAEFEASLGEIEDLEELLLTVSDNEAKVALVQGAIASRQALENN